MLTGLIQIYWSIELTRKKINKQKRIRKIGSVEQQEFIVECVMTQFRQWRGWGNRLPPPHAGAGGWVRRGKEKSYSSYLPKNFILRLKILSILSLVYIYLCLSLSLSLSVPLSVPLSVRLSLSPSLSPTCSPRYQVPGSGNGISLVTLLLLLSEAICNLSSPSHCTTSSTTCVVIFQFFMVKL